MPTRAERGCAPADTDSVGIAGLDPAIHSVPQRLLPRLDNGGCCISSIDTCNMISYIERVIRSFRHRPLRDLWQTGRLAKVDRRLHARILERLDVLDAAERPEDMNVPGYDFHALKGFRPTRYTVHVNGPICITFEFDDGDALAVDLENYH